MKGSGLLDSLAAYSFQASTKQHSSVFFNLNRRPPLSSQWGSHNQSLPPFSSSSWNRVTSLATVVLRVEPWHRGVGNACHLAKDYRFRRIQSFGYKAETIRGTGIDSKIEHFWENRLWKKSWEKREAINKWNFEFGKRWWHFSEVKGMLENKLETLIIVLIYTVKGKMIIFQQIN